MKNFLKLVSSIFICQLAGLVSVLFMKPPTDDWYVSLIKPIWNPPSWVFAPVWLTLYSLMGIALYLVWIKQGRVHIGKAVSVFMIQLVLNSLWSIIFFTWHNIFWAFIDIIALLLMVVISTIYFYKIDKRAGYLLIPYILWVCIATALNYNILILN